MDDSFHRFREGYSQDDNGRVVSWTTTNHLSNGVIRQVTITSKGFRNWRIATPRDGGIVFLTDIMEFGDYDDDEDENGSSVAIIYTQSGKMVCPRAHNGVFRNVRVVPREILEEARGEERPHGSFLGN